MTYIVIGAIINLSNEREVIKMKKVISIICVLGLMFSVLCVGYQQRVEATTTTTEETTINVTTTMMNNCWNDDLFKGNVRIEQMFVTNVEYSDDDVYNVVTLEDTQGNEWEYENIDLFLYEDVLVLMCDNETPEDITDDVIIHCWVGME